MNNKNTLSYALKRLQAQLNELNSFYTAAFADSITDQRVVFNRLIADSFTDIQKSFDIPTSPLVLHTDALNAALYEAFAPLQEMLNETSKACGAQISEMLQTHIASSFEDKLLPLLSSFTQDEYRRFREQIELSFAPLIDAIGLISITPSYVEVPKQLIPNDFKYDVERNPSKCSTVKLSHEQAQFLIGSILVPLLIFFFTYLENRSPSDWQESYHREEMAALATQIEQNNILIQQNNEQLEINKAENELRQQQLEVEQDIDAMLKAICQHLNIDLDQLSEVFPTADGIPPEAVSHSPYTESLTENIPSLPRTEHLQHSTDPDVTAESEQPLKPD